MKSKFIKTEILEKFLDKYALELAVSERDFRTEIHTILLIRNALKSFETDGLVTDEMSEKDIA